MSAADTIVVAWGPGQTLILLFAAGRPVEIVVDRPGLLTGSLILGRVVQAAHHLKAAFVDIGWDRPGFLAGGQSLAEGQNVVVRVRAEARDGKGAILVPVLDAALPEGKAPRLLEPADPLGRMLAANPSVRRILVDDGETFARLRGRFGAVVEPDRDGEGLSAALESLALALAPAVPLPAGGRIVIEATAALTAIDVDSGRSPPSQANAEALPEIARQLRLRNLGGQIVVDFVSAGRHAPARLAEALAKAVAADPVPCRVLGATRQGLVELSRERRALSLPELLQERPLRPTPLAAGLAALRHAVAEAAHRPGGRPLALVLAPEAAAAVPPPALAEAEARIGRRLILRPQPGRSLEDHLIEEVSP